MRPTLLVLAICLAPASAQVCGTGQTLFKNDNLPAVPAGPVAVSVVPGLCEGEACGAVFDVAALGPAVKLNLASTGFFNAGGANGITAAVDLEVFDGVTFSGTNLMIANLGPSLFRWSTATGSSLSVASHAINESPDLSSFNVVATSGKLVVAWWMDFTTAPGTCATGYQTNFGTDNTVFQLTCSSAVTPPQKNLIYILGQGWRDAARAVVNGIPICPFFYSGNWVIRACVEPAAPPPPPTVLSVLGPSNPPPGFFLTLQFGSAGDPGQTYVCGVSLGTTPGIPWPPYGTIPLQDDFALQFLLPDILEQPGAATNLCTGFTGVLGPAGIAYGNFHVPPASGVTVYFAFVTLNGHISNAAGITIL
jgi:hypothetical protein